MAIKLTWDDLLIREAPGDLESLYSDWRWLLAGRFRPFAWSKFGDSFVEREDGAVQFLDVVEGELTTIADSQDHFYQLINQQEHQEEWLSSLLIWELHHVPLVPDDDECYALKVHPVLGGKLTADNVTIMKFGSWVTISGQLYRQAR